MFSKFFRQIPKADFFGKSDVGLKRAQNEDAFVVRPELGLCLVADGMGGAAAGEQASRIFTETTLDVFSKNKGQSQREIIELVQNSFILANKRILSHVKEYPHHKGMGCTAEVAALCHNGVVVGHLGDSRTYVLRKGRLRQMTKDHSFVQEQIDQGLITPVEARTHQLRNVILRAVGVSESLSPDIVKDKTVNGDLFLLCSDGLTDMIEDALIEKILSSATTLHQKTDQLIESAKAAGGNDNISVVLSQIK